MPHRIRVGSRRTYRDGEYRLVYLARNLRERDDMLNRLEKELKPGERLRHRATYDRKYQCIYRKVVE